MDSCLYLCMPCRFKAVSHQYCICDSFLKYKLGKPFFPLIILILTAKDAISSRVLVHIYSTIMRPFFPLFKKLQIGMLYNPQNFVMVHLADDGLLHCN